MATESFVVITIVILTSVGEAVLLMLVALVVVDGVSAAPVSVLDDSVGLDDGVVAVELVVVVLGVAVVVVVVDVVVVGVGVVVVVVIVLGEKVVM